MGQEIKKSNDTKPWYRHWLAITIIVFTFPVSLPLFGIYYAWAKTNWNTTWKAGATIILLPFLLFGSAIVFSKDEANKVENTSIVVSPLALNQESDTSTTSTETKMDSEKPVASDSSSDNKPEPAPITQEALPIPTADFYLVTKVVDGDTFRVDINGKEETIRLIGINTPETVDPRKPVECFGKEASDKAKSLLGGKKVRLEIDLSQGERDKYSRLLRYAYLENGSSFNKVMISEGYAFEYTYNTPYKYQSEYKQAQAEARAAKRGLWADDACPSAIDAGNNVQTAPNPPASAPTDSPQAPSGHTFYTSSHYSAKLYYCDTDEGWKSLSTSYLRAFTSERELLAAFPSRKLHEACK